MIKKIRFYVNVIEQFLGGLNWQTAKREAVKAIAYKTAYRGGFDRF